jgi:hypothetical protein
MTFKEYLQKRRITYDACGDFVVEALATPRMIEVRSWRERETVVSQHNDFNGVQAAKSVWLAYLQQRRTMAKPNA